MGYHKNIVKALEKRVVDRIYLMGEDAEHLLLMDVAVKRVGRRAQRKGQVEAVVVGFDVEQRDIARRGGQRAVEVTRRVVERVELAVKPRTGVQKRDLVRETTPQTAFCSAEAHCRASAKDVPP